ncbi:MAG: hypothetical protein M4579_005243 [Chaenotheca gracillima]|nr:MAG: hypothetical protein M4579_005243 [Chaenotheca gracillima]
MQLTSSLLLALPLLAGVHAEEQQNPLGALYNKISAYLPNAPSTGPVDAGAAKVADKNVATLKERNWRPILTSARSSNSAGDTEEWWVYITGGNKTCFGQCGKPDKAWTESVAMLSATPNPPHLAKVDCEDTPILCNSWAAGPPAIWHFLVPHVQELPTTIRIMGLNATTVTANDILKIHNTQSWKKLSIYEGPFHPFDGWVQKFGLSLPVAYVLWAFAMLPSWAFMIVISFVSRSFMGRRMQSPTGPTAPPAAGGS